jgi:hypothetical protein
MTPAELLARYFGDAPAQNHPLNQYAARLAELKRQYQERDAAYPVKPEQRTTNRATGE